MKIMQICFTKMVNAAGGAEKVLANMSNHFCKQYEVVDVGCDENIGKPFYKLNDNVKWINLGESCDIKIPLHIKVANELVKIARKVGLKLEYPRETYVRNKIMPNLKMLLEVEKPDVIVVYEERALVAIAEAGYDLSKVVNMFHMNSELLLQSFSDKQKDILKKVRINQVLLESDKSNMITHGYKNVICIPNIVPQYEGVSNVGDSKVIVCVGRLNKKHKRQHLLIEAFSKISSRYPDWKVHFYGDDAVPANYKQELVELIHKYHLEDICILKGKTDNIPKVLHQAAIFAFPSAYEGFPLALTEAMSMGVPVVGFKGCAAVNEIIVNGSNGILANANVDAFALALEELICDESKRCKYGLQAKEDMKNYSAEKIYGMWNDLFLSIE
ncbi:MAG: glycosyltransferase [Bacilli bacterium]|nr:glycosyltransferase [Bacilli bacterium]